MGLKSNYNNFLNMGIKSLNLKNNRWQRKMLLPQNRQWQEAVENREKKKLFSTLFNGWENNESSRGEIEQDDGRKGSQASTLSTIPLQTN